VFGLHQVSFFSSRSDSFENYLAYKNVFSKKKTYFLNCLIILLHKLILEAATKQSLMFQLITCAEQNMTFLDQNKTEQEEETRHSSQKKTRQCGTCRHCGSGPGSRILALQKRKKNRKETEEEEILGLSAVTGQREEQVPCPCLSADAAPRVASINATIPSLPYPLIDPSLSVCLRFFFLVWNKWS
jgi:hypothetical protein